MEAWERIEKVIEHLGLNKNSFSKEIGLSNNVTIGRIIKQKRTPSSGTLRKISNRFPEISYEWLLTGSGDMIKSRSKSKQKNQSTTITEKSPEQVTHDPSNANLLSRANYDRLVEALTELVNTNRELTRTNERLVKLLTEKMGDCFSKK